MTAQPQTALPDPLDQPHILVVDDDRRLRNLIGRYLAQNGFLVTEADQAEPCVRSDHGCPECMGVHNWIESG